MGIFSFLGHLGGIFWTIALFVILSMDEPPLVVLVVLGCFAVLCIDFKSFTDPGGG